MKICKTHPGKEFKLRDGSKGPFYSHVISGDKDSGFKYHNSDFDKIDAEVVLEGESKEPVEETTGKPTKSYDSMLICNAMNNTISLINAGSIEISLLEKTFKRLLAVLEGRSEPPLEQSSGV